ncbi:MAG: hypothetical protein EOO15_22700, partial [Chitinophagaceae bacterium]
MQLRSTLLVSCIVLLFCSCKKSDPSTGSGGTPRDTLTAGWSYWNTGLPGHLYDIYFTDTQRGFACGSAGIYRSTDGGNTWTDHASPYNLTNIAAFGNNTALFIGTDNKIIKTIDGTSFFSYIYNTPDFFTNFHDAFMVSATTCYATSGRYFWRITTNTNAADTIYNFGSFSNNYSTLDFIDVNNGWVNREGRLFHTTDGGLSWMPQFSASGKSGAVDFVSSQTGFFAIGRTVYKTTDGGTTATALLTALADGTGYMDVDFLDAANGFASDGKRVYKTSDGGANWSIVLVFQNLTIY